MEAQEIISLIEEYAEIAERNYQKAGLEELQAPRPAAKQTAREARNISNIQAGILRHLLEVINEKGESTHETKEPGTQHPPR
jgi:hypothetical protein